MCNVKQAPSKIMRPNRIIDGPCSFGAGNSMMGLDFVLMSWLLFSCQKCLSSLNIFLICPDTRVRHTEPCSEINVMNKFISKKFI